MPAQTVNLLVEQGATFSRTVRLKQADGTPVDLTGWSGRGQIRRTVRDETVLASFTVVIVDPSEGAFSIGLAAATTAGFDTRPAVYDIELVDGAGGVMRVLQGAITVSPEVTR